jgi:hypothetical protein
MGMGRATERTEELGSAIIKVRRIAVNIAKLAELEIEAGKTPKLKYGRKAARL